MTDSRTIDLVEELRLHADVQHDSIMLRAANEIERLRDAAENVIIAYGMGWDMDGVIERLHKFVGERS